MAHGAELYKANGGLLVTITDSLPLLLHSEVFTVAAYGTHTITRPVISEPHRLCGFIISTSGYGDYHTTVLHIPAAGDIVFVNNVGASQTLTAVLYRY